MDITLVFLLIGAAVSEASHSKPNIIVIIADDMGTNDVSFHGSNEIPTPNIDALAYNGVILNSHYTQALCTPSRTAFLTGKYPIHLGMQHLVILEPEPWGVPLNETLLPKHLKRNGYKTHAIGKWHLGFAKKEYTPTFRGFDSHFGYWQGLQDYYSHNVCATYTNECGYDMRRNMEVDWNSKGKYSTTLFTDHAVELIKDHDVRHPMFMYFAHLAPHTGNDEEPLQAPDEEIAKFAHIEDPERRIYAAMVSMLDQSVGKVVTALREKHMLENSIILFISDNGAKTHGIHANHGSNYPLRGLKNSCWEGSVRNIAAIWSPLIKKPQRVSNELIHISDWLPTFYSAAGLNVSELGAIDGKDVWHSISEGSRSPRTEFVYNIDDVWNYGAIRKGDWKYMFGSPFNGREDEWYGSSGQNLSYKFSSEDVLMSSAGVSLSGLVTRLQIAEMHDGEKSGERVRHRMLSEEKISRLRREATLDCASVNDEKPCDPIKSPCLFNVREDPCERTNLADTHTSVFDDMRQELERIQKTMKAPINIPRDTNADPVKWNGTWTNWLDQEDVQRRMVDHEVLSPLMIALISAACFACLIIIVILLAISFKKSNKTKLSAISNIFEDPMDSPTTAMTTKDKELKVMPVRSSLLV